MPNVLIVASVQRDVPVEVLARVMSRVQLAAFGLASAGYLLSRPAAAWLGERAALAAGGVCVLASAAAMLSMADIWRFGSGGS
jgi:hypothetical protein